MTNTEIKKWADLKKSLLAKENKDLIEIAIAMGSKLNLELKLPAYDIAVRQSQYNYKLSDKQRQTIASAIVSLTQKG